MNYTDEVCMVDEFGENTVHDIFESYQRAFMADVSKQLSLAPGTPLGVQQPAVEAKLVPPSPTHV